MDEKKGVSWRCQDCRSMVTQITEKTQLRCETCHERGRSINMVPVECKPSAWQYRFKMWDKSWSAWTTQHNRGDDAPDREWRPLYVHPFGIPAKDLWREIFDDLSDRSCFKGIDSDVMEELETEMVKLIARRIGAST